MAMNIDKVETVIIKDKDGNVTDRFELSSATLQDKKLLILQKNKEL